MALQTAALAGAVAVAAAAQAPAQPPRQESQAAVDRLLADARVTRAFADLDRTHDRLIADTVSITEVPAPSFDEGARAAFVRSLMAGTALADVGIDGAGNVTGVLRGTGGPGAGQGLVAIAAHLDTVFPAGTDVHVRRSGTRLAAPGVGDDSQGLAVLLALVRAMSAAGIQPTADVLVVADVGEEGAGDLRGVRYLFEKGPYAHRIRAFVSIDGAGPGDAVTTTGVGSKRYRATFRGPGGHSYGAFGLVNPAFAMANAIDKLSRVAVPASPRTTYNVGVVSGGTSVNAIPSSVSMDVDLRSESAVELDRLEKTFVGIVKAAADEENAARKTTDGPIVADMTRIGDRPAGETPRTSPVVTSAVAAIRALGMAPVFSSGSTDANLPMSLGIPAITIESGGNGGREHAPDEWIDVAAPASVRGEKAALLILLAIAGVSAS